MIAGIWVVGAAGTVVGWVFWRPEDWTTENDQAFHAFLCGLWPIGVVLLVILGPPVLFVKGVVWHKSA